MSVLNFKRLSTANILSLSFGSIVCADPKIVTGPVRLRFIGLKRKIFFEKKVKNGQNHDISWTWHQYISSHIFAREFIFLSQK